MEHKIFAQVGNSKNPRWMRGKVIEKFPDGIILVEVYGQKITVSDKDVKEYKRIKYDQEKQEFIELKEFVEKNWESLKKNVTEAAGKFFPEEHIKIDENEKIIYALDDCLSICGSVFEVETISSFVEVAEWSIVEYKQLPATRWEPEDFDEKQIGHAANNISASKIFLDSIWSAKCSNYWENKYYEIVD